MIRHYEKLGMIPRASRRASGYRDYSDADVERLSFIARARNLGVPLEEIAELLAENDLKGSERITRWIAMLDSKSADIGALKDQLRRM